MFLKEKISSEIKGRAYANEKKQHSYTRKVDIAFPTASEDAVITTLFIEAHEEHDMDTFGIPGAYIQTETDEEVIMVLEWPLSELMVKLYSKLYKKYVTINIKVKSLT